MTTISLKLPEDLAVRLASEARRRGRSKSAVVREVLEQYLLERGTPGGSCLDLAADLVGCTEGPADLSHNDKHLRGFGQ